MGSAAAKAFGYFERFAAIAAQHPLLATLLILCILPPSIWCVASLWRGRNVQALWATIAIILVLVVFSWGDDTYTHVYRIVAVAEQIRSLEGSLLLTNSQTGVVVPTFVYYSPLPYILPVVLNLIGLPALAAFKIALCVQLVVMGLGVQRIVERTQPTTAGFLAAVLFVSANYTYEVWVSRAAFAELWVYSVVPWVISNSLPSRTPPHTPARNATISLTLVFFLQAVAHPIVLAHSLICEVPVVLALSRQSPLELARRWLVPFTLALVLAIPFWLPQVLWQSHILGPAALPVDFRDTFQTASELLDPKNNRNIGTWLPLAVVLLVVLGRLRLSLRTGLLIACCAVLMGLQSIYLRSITQRIPTLELSLFVWRLMLPAAMLAFAALLAGWREAAPGPTCKRNTTLLAWLAGISAIFMAVFTVLESADYFPHLAAAKSDRAAMVAYDIDKEASIWGIREYIPNYEPLKQTCFATTPDDVRPTRFAELRAGLAATRPYVAVEHAPVGMVDYRVDGQSVQPSFCGETLVLGPLAPGATISVAEHALQLLLFVRCAAMGLLALFLAFFLRSEWRRRRGMVAA